MANGRKIERKEKGLKFNQMAASMKGNGEMVSKRERAFEL